MKRSIILLVEDNEDILRANKRLLEIHGYAVLAARSLEKAREALKNNTPDAIILDIMLPDGSGLSFCRELRTRMSTPILFLTALGEIEDVLTGLRIGGDDYLTKPYNYDELVARIESMLRRAKQIRQDAIRNHTRRIAGPILMEVNTRRVFYEEKEIYLKPKEFDLLLLLITKMNEYITADEINQTIWGREPMDDARTIYVHLSGLRKKLNLHPDGQVNIEHLRHRGYRLYVVGNLANN